MSEVSDEHLEYLSLPNRSAKYRQAIQAVLKPEGSVADLGCGVGVLGMFCLEAGAKAVWGIDKSDAIELARESARQAGLSKQYHCIADSTFRAELPDQVDLIICDHVGFFGFDYGMIEMLDDARRRFLKPGGAVMPQALGLVVAGVSSDACAQKAAAWTAEQIPDQFRWLDEHHRNSRHHHSYAQDDFISEPVVLGEITLDEEVPELFKFQCTLTMQSDGQFDGVAGWFDCHLGGGVRMSNSPFAPDSIERAQAFLPAETSFEVERGDEVGFSLTFRRDLTLTSWTITPPGAHPRQSLSTWKSKILRPEDLVQRSARAPELNAQGVARAFILSKIDGKRLAAEIEDLVLSEYPDLYPTELAIREFVRHTLAMDCAV
ncbi:MAG: methyltransferase domain-containing protein [Pseudomonadota bacterium]